MEEQWTWKGNLTKELKDLARTLEAWDGDTFGNIFKRKQPNSLRLEGVTKAMERHTIEGLLKLDRKLREEQSELLLQEEILWLQKAKNEWLKDGDGSTNFFSHTNPCEKKKK